ncbi:MAG: hypothetical protein MZV64_28930 [Ignavibacteriales bacterium]|nr:hypothetical protein [Ignavibacteriales bacterium]
MKEERQALLVVLDDSREARTSPTPSPISPWPANALSLLCRAQVPTRGAIYFNGRRVVTDILAGWAASRCRCVRPLCPGRSATSASTGDKPITASEWRVH